MSDSTMEVIRRVVWGFLRLGLGTASGWLIAKGYAKQEDIDQLYTGLAGIGVLAVVAVIKAVMNVKLIKRALDLAPGADISELKAINTKTGQTWMLVLPLLLLIPTVGMQTACNEKDKTNLLKTNATAVILLQRGLEAADVSHKANVLSADGFDAILQDGEKVRKVLVELNQFAVSLPDTEIPSEQQKAATLLALQDASKRIDSLVAQEVIFKSDEAKREYSRYMKPAQAALRRIIQIVTRLKVKPAPTS